MIREVLVSTIGVSGQPHLAPMGVRERTADLWVIAPFRPSTTLENLAATGQAVVNATDDVRVIAGCLTGRRDWPLLPAERVACPRLAGALAHTELEVVAVEDDAVRPAFVCRPVWRAQHAPFTGFNRAQFAVLEAAILVSRLDRLPGEEVARQLAALQVLIDKTAGEAEREAWGWLLGAVAQYGAGK